MGQYYVIANNDKREFIDPHVFGSGVKLMEFSGDSNGSMMGLAILLASSNGQGGGDLHLPTDSNFDDIPGRWAGDRIVVAGDYDDRPESPGYKVYSKCGESNVLEQLANTMEPTGAYINISHRVLGCLLEDHGFRSDFLTFASENAAWNDYTKKRRREEWVVARPNDAIPAELA